MAEGILRPEQMAEWKDHVAEECSSLIDHAIKQVSTMSHLLLPTVLDDVGLQSALQFYLEGFTTRSGIEATLKTEPSDFPRLNAELETAILRIVQGALTNVSRNSGALQASVELINIENQIALTIRDNGKGLFEEILQFHRGSVEIGIGGMKQRIKEFSGYMHLENTHPGGRVKCIFLFMRAQFLFEPGHSYSRNATHVEVTEPIGRIC